MAHSPITNRMLNTAEPTMVPTPTSPFAINTPLKKINYKITYKVSCNTHHSRPILQLRLYNKELSHKLQIL